MKNALTCLGEFNPAELLSTHSKPGNNLGAEAAKGELIHIVPYLASTDSTLGIGDRALVSQEVKCLVGKMDLT